MNRTAMSGPTLGLVLLLSIAMRGWLPSLVAPTAGARQDGSASRHESSTETVGEPPDGPWKATQKFFAGTSSACAANAGSSPRVERWGIPCDMEVRAVIAIAPDPRGTHMALTFDRFIEGIQLAAADARFVMDRYWLPWPVPAESGTSVATPETAKSSAKNRAVAERRAAEPGLVLFRWNGGRAVSGPQLLLVFLVADTSTAGIDGEQFSKAVAYVDEVMSPPAVGEKAAAPSEVHDDRRIRVVGPAFSGSLASLRRLTDSHGDHTFFVYSGSVSSLCAMANQGLTNAWPPPEALCGEAPTDYDSIKTTNVTFVTFVHDTESAVGAFVRTIIPEAHQGCTHPQIALLSEGGTTYGSSVTADRNGQRQNPCIANFGFPREIGSLRNAARTQVKPAATPQGTDARFLPLDLTDPTNGGDAPPDYSRQGPLSKEAVLMNMAAALGRGHYRYIGILGSNVLDLLFLTDFLRATCPDARLFTFGADLLFERQFDNAPYIGMLAITTYNLTDRELDPGHPPFWVANPPRPFADEYEQGEFNAARRTIGDLVPDSETAPPSMPPRFAGDPVSPEAQAIWMMVAGAGGYWPVRLLTAVSSGSELPHTPTMGFGDFSGSWELLLILITTVAVFHVAIVLTASPFAQRFRDFALATGAPVQRLFFIQTASAILALGLVLLLMPAWRYAVEWSGVAMAGTAMLILVLAVAFLAEAIGCLRAYWEERVYPSNAPDTARRTVRRHLVILAFVWLLMGTASYQWWLLLGADPSSLTGFFFAYRAVHLVSGVSPITPMMPLLAAAYSWALFEVWRLRFNDAIRPRLAATERGRPAAGEVSMEPARPVTGQNAEESIAAAIASYWLRGGYIVLFLIAFTAWLTSFHPSSPFVLFDARRFEVLYAVLFCLMVAIMVSAGFRMAWIWASLRRLLAELERSRERATFLRLEDRSWSFWRQGGQEAEWTYMARSIEAVRRLGHDASLDVVTTVGRIRTDLDLLRLPSKPANERWIGRTVAYLRDVFVAPHSLIEYVRALWRTDRSGASGSRIVQMAKLEKDIAHLQESLAVVLGWTVQALDRTLSDEQVANLETFAALRYVAFVRGALGHLRHVMIFLALSFSLVLISLNVYSFEPHRSLIWSFIAIFVVVGVLVVSVLSQLHRDPIMRRITNTTANGLDLHFYLRIAAFGALPLLTLLATNFPSIGRFLVSFLGPSLEALK